MGAKSMSGKSALDSYRAGWAKGYGYGKDPDFRQVLLDPQDADRTECSRLYYLGRRNGFGTGRDVLKRNGG